eukprot:GILJ01002556.1.p1 GENE.GILJ01002556.1~~GILJ01002556.1.p1  ORF type:complete len:241 (+),score=35.15 GILJ01002556.1:35-757(+)
MMRLCVFAAVLLVACVLGQDLPVPPLPYDYNALEPFIDEPTMRVHHLGHHAAYAKKLSVALEELRRNPETKQLAKSGIDNILRHLDQVPSSLRNTVRNQGGGYVNHDLFWKIMSPNPAKINREPQGQLKKAIDHTFGSFEMFKQQFIKAASSVFGSGWAWLLVDQSNNSLQITATANQDTPASVEHQVPILGLDVWEHAYYLFYQNKRDEYISNWWYVVNWPQVEQNYISAANLTYEKDL